MGNYLRLLLSRNFMFIVVLIVNGKITWSQDRSKELNLDLEYTIAEATRQYVFGNIGQAKLLFSKCLMVDTNCAAASFVLSNIYLIERNLPKARSAAYKAYKINPQNYYYVENYGDILLADNSFKMAVPVLKETINLKAKPENIIKYCRALEKIGKSEEAIKFLEPYSDPVNLTFSGEIVRLLEGEGKFKKAAEILREMNTKFNDNIQIANDLAVSLLKLKNYKNAGEIFCRYCFNQDWTEQIVFNGLHFFMQQKRMNLADSLMKSIYLKKVVLDDRLLGLTDKLVHDKAIFSIYEKGISNFLIEKSESPNFDEKWISLLGEVYNNKGDYRDAESLLEPVATREDASEEIINQLLYTYNLNNNPKLEESALRATVLYPDNLGFKMMFGLGLMNNKKYAKAIDTFKEISNENISVEGKIQILIFLAELYEKIGDYEEADATFDEILRRDGNNILILNNYSYYLAEREQNLEKALKMIEKVVRKEKTNATYLDTYAWVLYKMGKHKMALKVIKEAIKFGGDKDETIKSHFEIIKE